MELQSTLTATSDTFKRVGERRLGRGPGREGGREEGDDGDLLLLVTRPSPATAWDMALEG